MLGEAGSSQSLWRPRGPVGSRPQAVREPSAPGRSLSRRRLLGELLQAVGSNGGSRHCSEDLGPGVCAWDPVLERPGFSSHLLGALPCAGPLLGFGEKEINRNDLCCLSRG